MPRASQRRHLPGCLSFAIGALTVAAVVLICIIAFRDRFMPPEDDSLIQGSEEGNYVDAYNVPESEVVLTSESFAQEYLPSAQGAATATPAPTATPVPSPTYDPNDPLAQLRPLPANENMLPVFNKANTEGKVIAITVDECSSAAMVESFLKIAQSFDAKLTFFPTGENILKKGMAEALKRALLENGCEIENRGYSGMSKLFQLGDTALVQEVWKQSVALSYTLGFKYEPHFFRMYGGLGENDPRTHAFLKSQGYLGIAHWTVNGSNAAANKIGDKLRPGGIYLFKTSQSDGEKMAALMRAAKDEGYRMVTLNELFGYDANNYYAVEGSLLDEVMPQFSYDDSQLYNLYPGEAAWAVVRLQTRLMALGYLTDSKADGIYGEGTTTAVRLFQAELGQAASGVADVATQERLYADDAPQYVRPAEKLLIEEAPLVPAENMP